MCLIIFITLLGFCDCIACKLNACKLNACKFDDSNIGYSNIKYCNLALKQCAKGSTSYYLGNEWGNEWRNDLENDLKNNWENNNQISIHGFWPEYPTDSFPQWCNKSACDEFSIDDLQMIRDDLENYWYSCQGWSTRTEDLWRHEWCRHGTCLTSNPLDYFTLALSAFKQASDNNWFHCCYLNDQSIKETNNRSIKETNNQSIKETNNRTIDQCMIPFNIHGNWLGYCH